MTKEVAEKIVRGIKDKIQCNTVDIDDWAEFWGFTREEYEEFLDMAIQTLEQQMWIPVSEGLPKIVKWYLTSIKCADGTERVTISWFDGVSFKAEVKAWMPLPQPYKAESEEV